MLWAQHDASTQSGKLRVVREEPDGVLEQNFEYRCIRVTINSEMGDDGDATAAGLVQIFACGNDKVGASSSVDDKAADEGDVRSANLTPRTSSSHLNGVIVRSHGILR